MLDIEFVEESGIVHVKATGTMDFDQIKEMVFEFVAVAEKHDCKKLYVDHRELTPEVSTLEIYDLPDIFEKLGFRRSHKMALIYSDSSSKQGDYRFYENVSRNRSFNVHLFTDPDKAMKWLMSES